MLRLDTDASKMALGYRYLPYFLHMLELLVHKTLEEEANSSNKEMSNILDLSCMSYRKIEIYKKSDI
jgi:hypothetical protein